MLTITTSWDDGDILDEKLARLLDTYGLRGTFYIAKEYRPARLSDSDIKNLSMRHEIGAHTLSHPNLEKLSAAEQKKEIGDSKRWLEDLTGKPLTMFCYPSGHANADSEHILRTGGFSGARTTRQAEISLPENPFQMGTTIQIYPFPLRKRSADTLYWRRLFDPLRERGPAFRKLGVSFGHFYFWESLAKASFDIALARGEVFHLWGHSWEIEKYGMWPVLERFLQYIANRPDCQYRTNGEICEK